MLELIYWVILMDRVFRSDTLNKDSQSQEAFHSIDPSRRQLETRFSEAEGCRLDKDRMERLGRIFKKAKAFHKHRKQAAKPSKKFDQYGNQYVNILAVGDIHGEYERMKEVVGLAPPGSRFVFMGDYMDRGPKGYAAANVIFRDGGLADQGHVGLLGNHDFFFLSVMKNKDERSSLIPYLDWLNNGGDQVLRELGIVPEDKIQGVLGAIEAVKNAPRDMAQEEMNKLQIEMASRAMETLGGVRGNEKLQVLADNMIKKGKIFHIENDTLFTHSGLPLDATGNFMPYNGLEGLDALTAMQADLQSGNLDYATWNDGNSVVWTGDTRNRQWEWYHKIRSEAHLQELLRQFGVRRIVQGHTETTNPRPLGGKYGDALFNINFDMSASTAPGLLLDDEGSVTLKSTSGKTEELVKKIPSIEVDGVGVGVIDGTHLEVNISPEDIRNLTPGEGIRFRLNCSRKTKTVPDGTRIPSKIKYIDDTNSPILVLDRSHPSIQRLMKKAEALKSLPETERIDRVYNLVFSNLNHGTPDEVDNMHGRFERKHADGEALLGDYVDLGAGVCKQMTALLYILGEAAGLDVVMQRGQAERFDRKSGFPMGRHAWNVILKSDGQEVGVDVMNKRRERRVKPTAELGLRDQVGETVSFASEDLELRGSGFFADLQRVEDVKRDKRKRRYKETRPYLENQYFQVSLEPYAEGGDLMLAITPKDKAREITSPVHGVIENIDAQEPYRHNYRFMGVTKHYI